MNSLEEWALEGESKEVDETERTLRYQIKHMMVCSERMQMMHQAGWHRRRFFTLVPAIIVGMRVFLFPTRAASYNTGKQEIPCRQNDWTLRMLYGKILKSRSGKNGGANNE